VLVGTNKAEVLSHATDRFAPSHYFNRTSDQTFSNSDFAEYNCGMRLAAAREPQTGNASSVEVAWNTVFPHQDFASEKLGWSIHDFVSTDLVLRNGAVSRAARERRNPYLPASPSKVVVGPAPPADGITIREAGVMQVASKVDLTLQDSGTPMPYVQAQRTIDAIQRSRPSSRVNAIAVGVLA
jgi:hypothetical protein